MFQLKVITITNCLIEIAIIDTSNDIILLGSEISFTPSEQELKTLQYFVNRMSAYDSAAKSLSFKNPSIINIIFEYYDDVLTFSLLTGKFNLTKILDKTSAIRELRTINKYCSKIPSGAVHNYVNCDYISKVNNKLSSNDQPTQTKPIFIIPNKLTI